jgi:Domain of unknown function (DUF1998)
MSDFLRQSQVITTFGPGSMVDLPERAVLIMGLQNWRHGEVREEIVEPRLQAVLRRKLQLPQVRLVKPPPFDERPGARKASIDARIFPTWFLVQEARPAGPGGIWRRRRLVRVDDLVNGRFRDDEDGARAKHIVPVRFVCGCPRGHLDDLDWRVFAHHGTGPSCGRRMWLEERGTSGDISETVVGCECGIQPRPLYDALGIETRALGTCKGRRPWLGPGTDQDCTHPYRLLVRSASNAYFPTLQSVISLPAAQPELDDRLDGVWNILEAADSLDRLRAFRSIPDVARALDGLSDEDAFALIEKRRNAGADAAEIPVKQAEFELLHLEHGTRGRNDADSPFYAEALERRDWDNGYEHLSKIERIVLVHRMREVIAQVGFTRFDAAGLDEAGEFDVGVERADLSPEPEWFPAVENRGEGIFLVFSGQAINVWLGREPVKGRAKQLLRGFRRWERENPRLKRFYLSAPYVMLHTVSHMLLTQIALECGYPAASLRERVYALPEKGMFGVLIPTGTSGADGTLGGLVETGRRMGDHLSAAIEAGRLCSNDPVCGEHNPAAEHDPLHFQGAACHGCLLIAETSCEQRNDWLDRALVVPTTATPDAAFFT